MENMDAEEIARIIQRAQDELREFGEVSSATSEQLRDAKVGIKGFSQQMKQAGKDFGHSMGEFGDGLLKGAKGTAQFNGMIETSAQALSLLILALGPAGVAAKVAAVAVTALAKGVSKVNEQNDRLYDGFRSLAQSGTIASDGISGLRDNLYDLNLSIAEFGVFAELVTKNSQSLALFANTTFDGRNQLALLSKSLKPVRAELMNMGISLEEQREGMMEYVALQSRIGLAQRRQNESEAQHIARLVAGSIQYSTEMDKLTKATGIQRKELQSEIDRARSEQRFRAKLDAMRASGDERQIAAARELELANAVLAKQAPETAQGFRDAASGFISSEAAGQLFMGTMGQSTRILSELNSGAATAPEALQQLYGAVGNTANQFNMLGQVGAYNETFGNFAEAADLGVRAQNDLNQAVADAAAEQDRIVQSPEERLDALTRNRLNQIELTRAAENALELAATAAAKSVVFLSDQAVAAAQFMGLISEDVGLSGIAPTAAEVEMMTDEQREALTRDIELQLSGISEHLQHHTAVAIEDAAKGMGEAFKYLGLETIGEGFEWLGDKAESSRISQESEYMDDPERQAQIISDLEAREVQLQERINNGKQILEQNAIREAENRETRLAYLDREITKHQTELAAGDTRTAFGFSRQNILDELTKEREELLASEVERLPGSILTAQALEEQEAELAEVTALLTRERVYQERAAREAREQAEKLETLDGVEQLTDRAITTLQRRMNVTAEHLEDYNNALHNDTTAIRNSTQATQTQTDATQTQTDATQTQTDATQTQTEATQTQTDARQSATDVTNREYLQTLSMIESGGGRDMEAETSSARGPFQFLNATWDETVAQMGKDYGRGDRYDWQRSSEVANYFTQQNTRHLEEQLGRQINATEQYAAHFMGRGGATKFLSAMDRDPSQSAAAVLGPEAAAANRSMFYNQQGRERTLQEFYNLIDRKFQRNLELVRADNTPSAVQNIPEYAGGGIADMPKSGGLAMLHGLEAVVPLQNGQSIPVSFDSLSMSGIGKEFSKATPTQYPTSAPDMLGVVRTLSNELSQSISLAVKPTSFNPNEQQNNIVTEMTQAFGSISQDIVRISQNLTDPSKISEREDGVETITRRFQELQSRETDFATKAETSSAELQVALNRISEKLSMPTGQAVSQNEEFRELTNSISAGLGELISESRRGNETRNRILQLSQS